MLWIISLVLLIIWAVGVLFNKGGLLHILLLSAISMALVQWVADRRAAPR